MALTFTPRTSTRGMRRSSELGDMAHLANTERFGDLGFDPLIRARDAFFEGNLRLPAEHFAQAIVVRIASAHALRAGDVTLVYFETRRVLDEVGESVDANEAILAEVERLPAVRRHQTHQPFDAVVDVAERPRLLAVAPNFDVGGASEFRGRDFSAQRRRCLLASAVPRAERSEDVVEPHDARVEAVVLAVVDAQALGDQLLPAVCILRLRRIGIRLLQRLDIGARLPVLRIYARGRGVEI